MDNAEGIASKDCLFSAALVTMIPACFTERYISSGPSNMFMFKELIVRLLRHLMLGFYPMLQCNGGGC